MSATGKGVELRTATRLVGVLALVWFMAMYVMHSFWFEPMAGGRQAPDLLPWGYGLDVFAGWREALGDEGRAAFLAWHSRGLDLVFPFLLSLALIALLTDILSSFARFRALPAVVKVLVPVLFAAPYGVADLMENATVAAMVENPGLVDAAMVARAESLTALKYAGLGLAFLVAGGLALAARAR